MGRVVTIAGPTKKVPRQFVCLGLKLLFPKHFHPDLMFIGKNYIILFYPQHLTCTAPYSATLFSHAFVVVISDPKIPGDCSKKNVDVDGEKRKIWCFIFEENPSSMSTHLSPNSHVIFLNVNEHDHIDHEHVDGFPLNVQTHYPNLPSSYWCLVGNQEMGKSVTICDIIVEIVVSVIDIIYPLVN
jgi:hypothetical protein